jgi:hypothetical protein
METKKVTAKTEEEFIKEVALDCVENLKDKDKDYIRENPFPSYYHFGYAMYVRNHYIHCRDFSGVDFWVEPDHLSSRIINFIFSLLLPEEYIFDDSFSEQLFDRQEFITKRKRYKEICGNYPVQMIDKYRKLAPKGDFNFRKLNVCSPCTLSEDDYAAELELFKKNEEHRSRLIDDLISELNDSVQGLDSKKSSVEE